MKSFNRIIIAACILIAAVFAAVNITLSVYETGDAGRQYRVDASRAAAAIEEGGYQSLDMALYPSLTAITPVSDASALLGEADDYLLREAGGQLYRFDYRAQSTAVGRDAVNIGLGAMGTLLLGFLIAVRFRVLKPFERLREVPYELSKGNLTVPIDESRQRLFGRFNWGMNMLRDNLEQQKQRELELQAEKKKLIISLSHDIKIPLSAVKLYSSAIEKGLYDAERTADTARRINAKADEIEGYVSQIVKASNEDFLSLTVNKGEFYLDALTGQIENYYHDKLALLGTEFEVRKHTNCLLCGDIDRAVEVLQNIIENAIKYSDGKRVEVSFSDEEDCRLITVSNSGCELPADELPHIFDSFYRGSNAGSSGGSGLGLYICRTLMRKMDGDIFAGLNGGEMRVTAVFRRA